MIRRVALVLTLGLALACASGRRTGQAPPQEEPRAQPVAVLVASTEEAAGLPAVALAPGLTAEELEGRVAQFAPVQLDFDETLLDAE
ncbi:MAG TPA: hypothetical protein VJP59_04385, partial [Gemmatimonadota bacterium]|nr:hypothetical protein [Gemmatimonadota bacterium]